MTGKKPSKSYCSARYTRLKTALSCVKKEHYQQFKEAHAMTEQELEEKIKQMRSEFWTMCAANIEKLGVNEGYSVSITLTH